MMIFVMTLIVQNTVARVYPYRARCSSVCAIIVLLREYIQFDSLLLFSTDLPVTIPDSLYNLFPPWRHPLSHR